MPKKLIEVSLPLEEINKASAREKSIRHGHPSTLHLWWARRPLAAARAVIFSSLITDPSDPEYPWETGAVRDIDAERAKLHEFIVELVQWENSTNEKILNHARALILKHTNGNPPPLLDPFAGGGAIPLEAQRLGLEAHASDLNPVAVLINKAMIEIPPKFAGMKPVNPDRKDEGTGKGAEWKGAAGLADDVRYYGKWMRDEAERRIGHLYPKVQLPDGSDATVIAWLWARTVTCPNPACGAEMPLISSYWLSKKKGKEAWLEPVVTGNNVTHIVRNGAGEPPSPPKVARGAKFACTVCGNVAPDKHIKSEGASGRMGAQLISIVAETARGRAYVNQVASHESVAKSCSSEWKPTQPIPGDKRAFWTPAYGLTTFGDLFTERQLVALTTFSDLVGEARENAIADAKTAGRDADPTPLAEGGTGATAYGDAIATYMAFAVDRLAESLCTISRWQSAGDKVAGAFGRQALPMVWDFAEVNPFSSSTRNFGDAVSWVAEVVELLPGTPDAGAGQQDATRLSSKRNEIVCSTDPPYYDNIGYADLSDYFYVWLSRTLKRVWPDLFATRMVPKDEELVATPYRFGGNRAVANRFFEDGLKSSFRSITAIHSLNYPLTIYYAYKQAETSTSEQQGNLTVSTGWETMLEGVIRSGLQINSTWPIRTERGARMVGLDTNALASSIVLACRVRDANAPEITRQQFVRELRQKLATDLRPLQQASIAPVDLAQAAIGPGMAIYSRYSRVREASGDALPVRGALVLINQALDEVLAEQDSEYDSATRWAISWYEQHAMNEGKFGDAEGYARARNVAIDDLAHDGVVISGQGRVRFVWREDLPVIDDSWRPRNREDVADWTITQLLARAVQQGQSEAARVKSIIEDRFPGRTAIAHDLAYRLHAIADRKGWTREALIYNTLVQNWADVQQLSTTRTEPDAYQPRLVTG